MKKSKIKNGEILHDNNINENKLKNKNSTVAVLPKLYAKSKSRDDSEIMQNVVKFRDDDLPNNLFSSQSLRVLPTINPPYENTLLHNTKGRRDSLGDNKMSSVLPEITLEISRNLTTMKDSEKDQRSTIGLFSLSQLNEDDYEDDNNSNNSLVSFSNSTITKHPLKQRAKLPQLSKKLREDIHAKALIIKPKFDYSPLNLKKRWLSVVNMITSIKKYESIIMAVRYRKNMERIVAGIEVFTFFRRKLSNSRRMFLKRNLLLNKQGWRLRLFGRIVQKKLAANTITHFLRDYLRYKMPVTMKRFRANAIRLQRYFRSFLTVTSCRLEALSRLWSRIEKPLMSTLIPYLLEKEQEKRDKAILADFVLPVDYRTPKKNKNTTSNIVYFPSLAREVNRVKYQMDQLTATMRNAKIMLKKCPLSTASKALNNNKHSLRHRKMNKLKELRIFLDECRHMFKVNADEVIHDKSGVTKLGVADAKIILKSNTITAEKTFFRYECIRSRKTVLILYTGLSRILFNDRIENFLRKEHGLRLM